MTLALEQQNTLRVGDLAELRIPSDHRYSYSGIEVLGTMCLFAIRDAEWFIAPLNPDQG